MQFPESWLRAFCNPPLSTQEIADTLTMMMEESERDAMTQKLQLLKRELFEIRDLLSSVH